ncbi:MAG: hypothetical protein LBF83_05755, partial [Spirochaetaceae bacterium]|nr:hypothetical protein [Spirochaetaceae bacterium]
MLRDAEVFGKRYGGILDFAVLFFNHEPARKKPSPKGDNRFALVSGVCASSRLRLAAVRLAGGTTHTRVDGLSRRKAAGLPQTP